MTTKESDDDSQFNTQKPGVFMSMGSNSQAQLGDGSAKNQWVPQLLNKEAPRLTSVRWWRIYIEEPAEFLLGRDITILAAGKSHAAAVVTGTLGLWTWGFGERGASVFLRALKNELVGQVACGGQHTLVLLRDGRLFAMGDNEYGQLGVKRGETTEENAVDVPVQISAFGTDKKLKQIGCGDDFSVGVTTTGDVYSWGRGQLGQLGLGESQPGPLETPTKLPNLPSIQKVAVGPNQVFAIEFTNVQSTSQNRYSDGPTCKAASPYSPPPPSPPSLASPRALGEMNPQQQYASYNPHHQQQQQQQQQFYARTSSANFATYTAGQFGANNPPSMGGGSPSIHAWVPHYPQEQQYYDMLFAHVDEQRRNAIGGQLAVAFFSRSHLEKAVLREVGETMVLSPRNAGLAREMTVSELSRNEFYVAMRLISMAQRGEQISAQRFFEMAAMQYPLPMLEGVPPPPAPVQAPAPVQPPSSGVSYAVAADEKGRYDIVFQQYDADNDGFLMGPEAVALFEMSGLDRNVLRNIWSMADVTQDSKLSIQEFYVAMHLIVCVSKRGLPMPPALPRDLAETAFGVSNAVAGVPSHAEPTPSLSSSRNGSFRNGGDAPTAHQPEGMDAFAGLSTVEDAPLPSLESTPRSSRDNSFNHAGPGTDADRSGAANGFGGPVPIAPDSLNGGFPAAVHQDYNSLSASRTASIASGTGRDRTNSASSLNSMSSFSGMAPMQQQQPPRNISSNERLQMIQAEAAGYQTPGYQTPGQSYAGMISHVPGSFAVPQPLPEKPFMSDEEEQKAVQQLDKQNEEVVLALSGVERKQNAIEALADKLRGLDELRCELVALVMKRDTIRADSASAAVVMDDPVVEQTKRMVERTLRDLVDNEKQLIRQLQCDVGKYESELEAASLSAKLEEKMSLTSPAPPTSTPAPSAVMSEPLAAIGGGGYNAFNAFSAAPLSIDGSTPSPSPAAAGGATGNSPFSPSPSPGATDSSGFNAFSNFDSAPISIGSTTPSPLADVAASGSSPFSPLPSPAATGNSEFTAFSDFATAPLSTDDTTPSLSPVVAGDVAEKSPFSPSPSPAAADNSGFNAFAAAPLSFNDAVPSSMQAAIADAPGNSPFSPSPSPAAANDSSGFNAFSDVSAPPLSMDSAAPSSSPVAEVNAEAAGNFAFSPSLSLAATDNSGFDAFNAAPLSNDSAVPSSSPAATVDAPAFSSSPSPATTDSGFDAFATFGVAPLSTDSTASFTAPAAAVDGSASPDPIAADNGGFDAFGAFSAAPLSSDSTASFTAPVATIDASENSPFSPSPPPLADNGGFDAFGDFSAAPSPPSPSPAAGEDANASAAVVGGSPFSPSPSPAAAAATADNDGFNAFGDFTAASNATDATPNFDAFSGANFN
ncbi:hypothetical protein BBJ28_00018905 [Nothophytophthora sp. Chile5]|nr:hypothetical protein BBJ28_00018905 [Nothophytophthora sp. Chile5]